jgi:cell wall assembly regulator SMI1
MTHKEKDLVVEYLTEDNSKLVASNEALKKRIDFLESQNYEGQIEVLNDMNAESEAIATENKVWLIEAEMMNTALLYDVRELYKRLDGKNEDIQILNSLMKE